MSNCQHIRKSQKVDLDELKYILPSSSCRSCINQTSNLWYCLSCGYIGCGNRAKDHSSDHMRRASHPVAVNLKTFRLWCSACCREVYLQDAHDPASVERAMDVGHDLRISFLDDTDDLDPRPRGITGLKNLGNTCYLNSALQALSNCQPLATYFINQARNMDEFKLEHPKASMSFIFCRLMEDIWSKARPVAVQPVKFVQKVSCINPVFSRYTQQDSQEFLRCFLDCVHEELKAEITWNAEESPFRHRSQSLNDLDHRIIHGSECQECGELFNPTLTLHHVGSYFWRYNLSSQKQRLFTSLCERCFLVHMRKREGTCSESQYTGQSGMDRDIDQGYGEMPELDNQLASGDHKVKGALAPSCQQRKDKAYHSIVSDVFDGKMLSSVKCLCCNNVSTKRETFQDLSLPLPTKEDVANLQSNRNSTMLNRMPSRNTLSLIQWLLMFIFQTPSWIKSWFQASCVSLDDCLGIFFGADELKGNNMYSCENCNKLRNGMKYSSVLQLPEVLSIHLKRFRHDMMYSSKIGTFVSFPLKNLDMSQFMSELSTSEVTKYDLVGVICHHGTASGGHYIAYARNWLNGYWYEFDDQYVRQVSENEVLNVEAYVLFYQKSSAALMNSRYVVLSQVNIHQHSFMQYYVSKNWLDRYLTITDPGPITNCNFVCAHGGVPPDKCVKEAGCAVGTCMDNIAVPVPQSIWNNLLEQFGGGPVVNKLYPCSVCQHELEKLNGRRQSEMEICVELNEEFVKADNRLIYYLSMDWFRHWEAFVKKQTNNPPCPIDNAGIIFMRGGVQCIRQGADCAQISERLWNYFSNIYGGGPMIYRDRSNDVMTVVH